MARKVTYSNRSRHASRATPSSNRRRFRCTMRVDCGQIPGRMRHQPNFFDSR
jgi:hypothetical protein